MYDENRLSLDPTMCPGSSDPFYKVTYYYKIGHYFLDIQYLYNVGNHQNYFEIIVNVR